MDSESVSTGFDYDNEAYESGEAVVEEAQTVEETAREIAVSMEVESQLPNRQAWQTDEAKEARQGVYCCGGCCCITGLLLILILVPLSFKGVEYYEYGFLVRSSTGKVDLAEVFDAGNHFVGPDYGFKKFQADAHVVRYDALSVFSAGTNESVGLEFKLDVTFAYKLVKAELRELHNELERQYKGVVDSRARDGIKNEAVKIGFSTFFEKRTEVERLLFQALKLRLRPLHIDVIAFHLGRVEIPSQVRSKQLETKIQKETNDRELFRQQAEVERSTTDFEVNKVLLQKEQAVRFATAEASLIKLTADAESERTEKEAQSKGLQTLYASTGLTTDKHKASFDYIRTILRHPDASVDVGYVKPDDVVVTKDNA